MHNVNVGRPFCGTRCAACVPSVRNAWCWRWPISVGMFFVTKFFMVLIFVAFSVIGLILFVFAELFRQAIIYKEENEMTI